MTGFAVQSRDFPSGTLSVELRAVNSRFLDLVFRMGEDFRALEPIFRERIGEAVRRGKLECRVNYVAATHTRLPETVNTALLQQLMSLSGQVCMSAPDAKPMSVAEILRWPGMLEENSTDPEALHSAAQELLRAALSEFNASRAREGAKLKAVILERVLAMRHQSARLRPQVPEIVAGYRDKITKRMEEILQSPDHERIHQEVALFAQKIDVDEEIDRLLTHLDEIERVLNAGGATGKRLDFLMQELNREANTLGSKAVSLEFSQTSVEFKVLIEQMREQVQNLE
ncbi:MAG: YicC family protein [Hydrogenophilales bacterium]|nr:YicC family protein [Hydrogenophilales bacterium]